jgi:hypothetical protein
MPKKPICLPNLVVPTQTVALEADGDFDPDYAATTRLSNKKPIEINAICFHVELLEVDRHGDAVNPSLQPNIDAVTTLCGARPAEMVIAGRHYVAVIFPHEN